MYPLIYILPLLLAVAAAPTSSADNDDQDCENQQEWDGNIIENKDAAIKDGSAGIGIEFESTGFYFSSPECSEDDVNKAKKRLVGGRQQ